MTISSALRGTPCGNISGLVAACQKRIVRTMYTVPGAVAKIRDSDAKLYSAMRLAVAAGYAARTAGRIPRRWHARASSPVDGRPELPA